MISAPPKTGNKELDKFLSDIYQRSIPEDGWSLTDFTAPVSEVIGDKRDLIDIVTQYDDIEQYSEVIESQREYLDEILVEIRDIDQHAEWFSEIMEWWDQNYKIIEDASAAMASQVAASDSAKAAKTSETNASGSAKAADTSAKAAKTSETNAKTSETNSEEHSDLATDASALAILSAMQASGTRNPRVLVWHGAADPKLSDFPDAMEGDIIMQYPSKKEWKVEA